MLTGELGELVRGAIDLGLISFEDFDSLVFRASDLRLYQTMLNAELDDVLTSDATYLLPARWPSATGVLHEQMAGSHLSSLGAGCRTGT